jgi:hypothetical protein
MEGHAFPRAKKSHAEGVSALPKAEAKRLISLPLFLSYFLFAFSAQKSHVKSRHHLSPSNQRK